MAGVRKKEIKTTFHPLITTAIKSNLTPAIKAGDFDILEIDEHLMDLSKILQQKIEPGFEEYGLSVRQFYVTTVVLPEEDINYKKIRELHTISLQKKMLFAEADVKQAQAQAEADVITARRKTELERETTQTEILKREEERKILEAQTSAQAKMAEGAAAAEVERLKGLAAAEVMRAKGYTEKDILQADVQKAYAEGLGKLGSNAGGGSSGGGNSIMNDMIGLGMGIKAAAAVTGQFSNIFDTVGSDLSSKQPGPSVEKEQSGAFCRNCGAALPENARFCMECGTPAVNKCPSCGTELPPDAKFCLKCGTKVC